MITAVIEGRWEVREGDSAELLRELPDNSIDAMVCDPPAGIGFMGRAWDKDKGGRDQWIAWLSGIMAESLRVVKPGGHALVWALPRTSHWTATAVEDAGWEIRDVFHHLFGSGFPKSLDISKEIDKSDASGIRRDRALAFTAWIRDSGLSARAINDRLGGYMGSHYLTDREQPEVATAESFDRLRPLLPAVPDWVEELVRERTVESAAYKARAVVASVRRTGVPPQPMGWGPPPVARLGKRAAGEQLAGTGEEWNVTVPSTPEGAQWAGWGTGIKPAVEQWIWATKPLNAVPTTEEGHSRGAEHWILARKPIAEDTIAANVLAWGTGALNIDASRIAHNEPSRVLKAQENGHDFYRQAGRYKDVLELKPEGRWPANVVLSCCGEDPHVEGCPVGALERQSEGSSKFFYQAKPSRAERDHGLGHLPHRAAGEMVARAEGSAGMQSPSAGAGRKGGGKNHHPTVKSTGLMDHLIGLVTPPGGIVLDPFCGSGSTGVAAVAGGWQFLGMELDPEFVRISRGRIAAAGAQLRLFDPSTEEADQDGR